MSYFCSQILTTVCPCWFKKKQSVAQFQDSQLIEAQEFIDDSLEDSNSNKRSLDSRYSGKQEFSTFSNDSTRHSISEETVSQSKYSNHQKFGSNQDSDEEDSQKFNLQQTEFFDQYMDSLPKDHPYFESLVPKFEMLPALFNTDESCRLEVKSDAYPLRMYCTQNEQKGTNIFQYFFTFKSTHQAYQNLLNNFGVQKSFDSNIDEYQKKIESPDNCTKVIYLSYHKILIVAPREFIFARYIFKKGKEFWSICTSIPHQNETPNNKIRGEIVLTATKVVEDKKEGTIDVSVYSEIDMKMKIKPEMAKGKAKVEIKKYLDKCHEYLKHNNAVESII